MDRPDAHPRPAARGCAGRFSYQAYGLGIHSAIPLPELVFRDVRADVLITMGEVRPLCVSGAVTGRVFRAHGSEVYFSWPGVADALVRDGREITVQPHPSVPPRELSLYLLGAALAMVLQQRGRLVLHASAVATPRGAVLFTGETGWGKSTLAAAMHRAGHPLLADDVAALHVGDDRITLAPAFPALKLWPDSLAALEEPIETLPRIHGKADKRARVLDGAFPEQPLPLSRVYVLDPPGDSDAEPDRAGEITPLRGQDAFVELVRHTYCVWQLPAAGQALHFRQCAELVARVPIRRLRRAPGFRLPELVRLVEEDLGRA
ncbi:MAG TPA: serine kinase [Armatimonadota bacterium]|nr:serine kinase [Armatimonadota bacterium]